MASAIIDDDDNDNNKAENAHTHTKRTKLGFETNTSMIKSMTKISLQFNNNPIDLKMKE